MLERPACRSAENWIFSDGFVERLRFEIDPGWQGDIPRTLLISREGTITTIEGSAEMAEVEKWSAQQRQLTQGRWRHLLADEVRRLNAASNS